MRLWMFSAGFGALTVILGVLSNWFPIASWMESQVEGKPDLPVTLMGKIAFACFMIGLGLLAFAAMAGEFKP